MRRLLDFERPIYEVEKKINELKEKVKESPELEREIKELEERAKRLKEKVYKNLTRWQIVQIARHPDRPHFIDYIHLLFKDFIELHGDRNFRDDPSIVAGLATFENHRVMVIGQEKGRDTKEKIYRNFGMPHPEGYRKAKRLMLMAEKFGLPVLTFVDTPGAYPGVGAEERGQAFAIAENLKVMLSLRTPLITVIIGEGGSGGALAIALGDRVYALKYTIYSVISPEGCASILWRDGKEAPRAAEALKLTAQDLYSFDIIDGIIDEPLGGAHNDPEWTAEQIKRQIRKTLPELMALSPDELIARRREKYVRIGKYIEIPQPSSS